MALAMEARSLPDMAMVSKAAMADNPNNQAMVEVTAVVTANQPPSHMATVKNSHTTEQTYKRIRNQTGESGWRTDSAAMIVRPQYELNSILL